MTTRASSKDDLERRMAMLEHSVGEGATILFEFESEFRGEIQRLQERIEQLETASQVVEGDTWRDDPEWQRQAQHFGFGADFIADLAVDSYKRFLVRGEAT